MKINRVLLVALLVASMMSLVFMPRTVSAAGIEYIVVAWDEEFNAKEYYQLFWWGVEEVPIPFTRDYVNWQWSRAMYWWNLNFGEYVQFQIAYWTTWDSDDSYYLEEMLLEAEQETGFASGAFGDSILIAFTGQLEPYDGIIGGCIPENKSIIIRNDRWDAEVLTDNVILHELSHFWYSGHSTGECIMSYDEVFIGWYDEPLQPDWGHLAMPILRNGRWGHFSYSWSDHNPSLVKTTMIRAMQNDYPPPPDPWMEAPDPPMREILICYAIAGIALAIGIACAVYFLVKRYEKHVKVIENKQSAIRLMTIPFLTVTTIDFLLKSVIGFYTFVVKDLYADFLDSGEFRIKESRDYTRKSPTRMYIRKRR